MNTSHRRSIIRTLIVLFSQTNNTRNIAHRIAKGIAENGWECDLLDLERVDPDTPRGYDLVGLGSPVFYYQEPFNVREYLNELPELAGQPWFLFCTHGSVIGKFFPSVARKLTARGASVIACFNSYADITVPYYPHPSYTTGHPDQNDFERAGKFGRDLAGVVRKKEHDSLNFPISSEAWIKKRIP